MKAHTKETQANLTPRMALDILKEGNDICNNIPTIKYIIE